MPDITDSKDKQFTIDCHDTVHVVEFSQLEFLTDLLAVGTTIRLIIVRCTAKVRPTRYSVYCVLLLYKYRIFIVLEQSLWTLGKSFTNRRVPCWDHCSFCL